MRILRQAPGLIVAATLLGAPAMAQQSMQMQSDTGASSPAGKAMMDSMSKMQQDMANTPMTGDPDKDFVAMMLPHHQSAIDMAKVELQYGKDPQMRKLAQGMVAAQGKEHAEMLAWQAKHPAK
jgi:uncharacterized protein (DUF305 family)